MPAASLPQTVSLTTISLPQERDADRLDSSADRTSVGRGEPGGAGRFASILFPPGLEMERSETSGEPGCFRDLNLDQIVAAAIAGRDGEDLRRFFHSPYRDEEIVGYRQEVFRDLEDADIFPLIPSFCDGMRKVRLDLEYARKIHFRCHRQMVVSGAIRHYCETIGDFVRKLGEAELHSRGLRNLRAYLADYQASVGFTALAAETDGLEKKLAAIRYNMLIHGDKVTVREFAAEADYSTMVRSRFERFRTSNAKVTEAQKKDEHSMNHVEEGVLDLVGRLYPEIFSALEAYLKRHADFIDETLARFDREVQFFLAYLGYIEPLKRAGLPFCYPAVSASSKSVSVRQGFDLALAAKLIGDKQPVVGNDFHLDGAERLIVVSGPNQGGKTTFARMFGQLHFLAGLGCPVPGAEARLFLADRIYTHFEREEDIANLRGKLEDELVRLHDTIGNMRGDSIVVLNEIFNSTSLEDQLFLSRKVLEDIMASDALGTCVTFIDELASLSEKTVSMVSTVVPDNPAVRTFQIVRRPADGLAYALSLAEKHHVTYERLRERIKP